MADDQEFTEIGQVISALEDVVAKAADDKDRIGFFACLYLQVTREIAQAIKDERFADGPRMSHFDAHFGNRYFRALRAYQNKADPGPPNCWDVAFDSCGKKICIVQHLLLGINAHINLDLAGAAADTAPGPAIESLKNDYMLVNTILSETLNVIQDELNKVSPVLKLIDRWLGSGDEKLLAFTVSKARGDAWKGALLLAGQDPTQQAMTCDLLDSKATHLARLISSPPVPRPLLSLVSFHESSDVPKVIDRINQAVPPLGEIAERAVVKLAAEPPAG